MTWLEQQIKNYESHSWVTSLVSTVDVYEHECYCVDCGMENVGHPVEFGIAYPHCHEIGD